MEQDKPELVSMEATYRQEEDSNAPSNSLGQFITIKAEDAGGGFFYVISTERWAANDPKELFDLLESFRRMVESPTNTTEG
jgi:hypothetical protein